MMNESSTAVAPIAGTVSIGNYLTHLDETKRGLAKLLARENINVTHANVPTAMFNVKTRQLVLPKFQNVTVDQYDLLIGHEVGHAKYSSGPESLLILEKCGEFPGLHSYVNVLEDTRIERLMKAEYPGLRGSFRRGYADFAAHGPIFQSSEPVDTLSFIDRINVEYKVGAFRVVPFTAEERAYFPRIDALDSMTAVFALAMELYVIDVEEMKKNPQSAQQPDPNGEASSQSPNQSASASSEGSEGSEGSEDSTESEGSEGSEGSEDSKESKESKDSKESKESKNSKDAQGTAAQYPSAKTDEANSTALQSLASTQPDHDGLPQQVTLRPLTVSQVNQYVISSRTYVSDVQTYLNTYPEIRQLAQTYLADFTKKHGLTIKHMAREFELKKSAKLAERAKTARTGRLDVTKLYAYKFREDLFKSVTILPNGQSHGIVVVIDGSGSMNSVMADTLDQALLFGCFAKSVGIPFQAVVFQDRPSGNSGNRVVPTETAESDTLTPIDNLRLVTVLDTQAGSWKEQLIAVAAFAARYDLRRSTYENRLTWTPAEHAAYVVTQQQYEGLPHTKMGSTPLLSALLVAERLVAQMKQAHRLDKMTLLIVTDGEDSEGLLVGPRSDRACIVRDTVSREVTQSYTAVASPYSSGGIEYRSAPTNTLSALVKSIQTRHGARVVTIKVLPSSFKTRYASRGYLTPMLDAAGQFAKPSTERRPTWTITEARAYESFKTTGQVVFHSTDIIGDAAILVSATRLSLEDTIDSREEKTQTAAQIKRAFVQGNVNQSRNRVFVQTVMPFLA